MKTIELYTASLFAHEQTYASQAEAEQALSRFCLECITFGVAAKSLKMDTKFKRTFSELHQREQYRQALDHWNGRVARGSFFRAKVFPRVISINEKFAPSSSFSYMVESII